MASTPAAPAPDAAPAPWAAAVMVRGLRGKAMHPVDISPASEEIAAIAAVLDLRGLSGVRLKGDLRPSGSEGWHFRGRLTADAVQRCIITLGDVPQRIDTLLERAFLPLTDDDLASEIDLDPDEDDDPDFFTDEIDLGALAVEALALALDAYPRLDGAEIGSQTATPPGAEPLSAESNKPFAALAKLRDKMGP
ncbi:MAG: YceD family protein [Pseudomonadota bacterium]